MVLRRENMKIIDRILNTIAILIIIAALVAVGYLFYLAYVIADMFTDFQWYEFAIVGIISAFVIWRVALMWRD